VYKTRQGKEEEEEAEAEAEEEEEEEEKQKEKEKAGACVSDSVSWLAAAPSPLCMLWVQRAERAD
jgi:hypothetical protein